MRTAIILPHLIAGVFVTIAHGAVHSSADTLRSLPGVTRWQPWQPSADAPLLPAQEILRAELSAVAPVTVEPSPAWIATRGVNRSPHYLDEPLWEVLGFDGESLDLAVAKTASTP